MVLQACFPNEAFGKPLAGGSAEFGSGMEQLSSTIVTHNSIFECRSLYGMGYLWEIS